MLRHATKRWSHICAACAIAIQHGNAIVIAMHVQNDGASQESERGYHDAHNLGKTGEPVLIDAAWPFSKFSA